MQSPVEASLFLESWPFFAIASQVLHTPRAYSINTMAGEEGIYEPQSLAGQVSAKDMGLRAGTADAAGKNTPAPKNPGPLAPETTELTSMAESAPLGYDSTEPTSYRPTDQDNQAHFETLVGLARAFLPDEPSTVVVSAADAILELLRADDVSVSERRKAVELLLATRIDDKAMADFISAANSITDYGLALGENQGLNFAGPDGDLGPVAVVFEEENEEESLQRPEIDPNAAEPLNVMTAVGVSRDDDTTAESGPVPAAQAVKISVEPSKEPRKAFSITDVTPDLLLLRLTALRPELLPEEVLQLTKSVSRVLLDMEILKKEAEGQIMTLLSHENLDFVKFCLDNRDRIYYGLRLAKDRAKTVAELEKTNNTELLQELGISKKRGRDGSVSEPSSPHLDEPTKWARPEEALAEREPQIIDLQSLVFEQGPQIMASTKVKLPKGSYQQNKKLYDIISVPAPPPPPSVEESGERLVPISELPDWAQPAFPTSETSTLNRVQSAVYPVAFQSDDNMLVCAPTGAGKTNVAMLAVLRVLANHRDKQFKAVYVAPLKALVAEQVREFQRRLSAEFGLVVNELTGDLGLSQREIAETHVLVTTPEKWDVVTRRPADSPVLRQVKLVIVDEIHLLHDTRGPVVESVVVRAKRQPQTRVVGLLATLPNYRDVGLFIGAPDHAIFHFGAEYRPCLLAQQYVGIKEKRAIMKVAAMNEAVLEKVAECRQGNRQLIVFVHSRKDTARTAQWLAERVERDTLAGKLELLKEEAAQAHSRDLAELLPLGFGIHHAGLSAHDRRTAEDLFAAGHLQCLVSTATLAWGVNLPANTVVIKGTDTYDAEKGAWTQLSPQDILQMLGRAGRPRYDVLGEGVIITAHSELQYYMAVLNQQLAIELQLMGRLPDALNAEVVLGAVALRHDAAAWLAQTYLYVRMLQEPALYGVADHETDPLLEARRHDLAHSALTLLAADGLCLYDHGAVVPTELGRIAAQYYLGHASAAMYSRLLQPWMGPMDIIKVFARLAEFRHVPVRREERPEVARLADKCPVPVVDPPGDPRAKVAVLLQAHVSRLALQGFALVADMVYVTQSAGRLLRAIAEISVRRRWAPPTLAALGLCAAVDARMWRTGSPFREFGDLAPRELVRASEALHLPFQTYFELDPAELAEAINFRGHSAQAHALLRQYPRVVLLGTARPVSPDWVLVQAAFTPDWQWAKVHGAAARFRFFCEDQDGQTILHDQQVRVTAATVGHTVTLDFLVRASQPLPPALFLVAVSDTWLHSVWRAPVAMLDMVPPKAPAAFTPVLDVQAVSTEAVDLPENPDAEQPPASLRSVFPFPYFNKFQSQAFHSLWHTQENVFVGLAKGGGKTSLAEVAVLAAFRHNKQRVVYLQPLQAVVDRLAGAWARKFAPLTSPQKVVAKLTGDPAADTRLMAQSHVVLATPAQFNLVAARWRQRKSVQLLDLVVADDIHGLDATYECVLSRLRFMAAHLEREIRVVALGNPLIYGRELGEWLGCSKKHVYNYGPMERPRPIREIRIEPFDDRFKLGAVQKRTLLFVPTIQAAYKTLAEVLAEREPEEVAERGHESELIEKVADAQLRLALRHGTAVFHEALPPRDRAIVERLVASGAVLVLVATAGTCTFAPALDHVVVCGTAIADRHYYVAEFLEMVGCARASVVAHVEAARVGFYLAFLSDGVPVESRFGGSAADVLVHEIAARTVVSRQACVDWITYTFFYRRLVQNPSFYGLVDTSHVGVSEFLSDLVETALEELQAASMVELVEEEEEEEEEEVEEILPLNGAMIAAHYSVAVDTVKTLSLLGPKARLRGILEAVAQAAEFAELPVREDEAVLWKVAEQVPLKVAPGTAVGQAPAKAFLLLQAHMSRLALPAELALEQRHLLVAALPIVHAAVDVLASDGHLNALQAMDLSQMLVQGMWNQESPLRQVPHVDAATMQRAAKYSVETVYDIMALEDDERDDVFRLPDDKLAAVAEFVNLYPNVDVRYTASEANGVRELTVTIERDEEPDSLTVVAPRWPASKTESWWVVAGNADTRQLYAIKKTAVQATAEVTLHVEAPGPLAVWVMCDSYIDADKEMEIRDGEDETGLGR